jgi:mono/diheme cytochrome c family protein
VVAKASAGAILALLALLGATGCGEGDVYEATLLVEGDPGSGRRIIAEKDCGACHAIPGIGGARGKVGPSLAGFAQRGYIAGELPNRPTLLVRWLPNAPELVPGTAMPPIPMTERQARDIASYLYTLD